MLTTRRRLSAISALFGVWVFVSAFMFSMSDILGGDHFTNNLVVGAAILALAGYNVTQTSDAETGITWASGLAALLGLWLIATPFVYGAEILSMASSIVSGIVVAVSSGYHALDASEVAGTPIGEIPST